MRCVIQSRIDMCLHVSNDGNARAPNKDWEINEISDQFSTQHFCFFEQTLITNSMVSTPATAGIFEQIIFTTKNVFF